MSRTSDRANPPILTFELRDALEGVLGEFSGSSCTIAGLERSASAYQTSSTMEQLRVYLEDGRCLHIMFKDVSRKALIGDAQHAKPACVFDSLREIETYRSLLAPSHLSVPTFYGAVVNSDIDRYWLFLEYVPAWTLFEVSEPLWVEAATWIAGLHARFTGAPDVLRRDRVPHLLRYDAGFYWMWPQRALAFVSDARATRSSADRKAIERIVEGYGQIVERLLSLPTTLIHGEFVAANVLIQTTDHRTRLCPVDWEMAAIGPGLMDLAALTAGSWTPEQRQTLTAAYARALREAGAAMPRDQDFNRDFDCCRLHLAMQWLGWSAEWSPPQEHAHNWLEEASYLAERLGL
jgi:aminoglycoside/choline kinase family phosphotransferase